MKAKKFTEIFTSLPPEAQQTLVETHLSGLLDQIPRDKSKKILAAASRLQNKYKSIPVLNLRQKRMQISSLFDDLSRDSKTSFIRERSNRDELLGEVVHSLTNWLNDIWSVVYEHNVNYSMAHTCLLFVADALTQLSDTASLGGCKCPLTNLPVEFTLKNKHGKVLKRYSFLGPRNIDRILLWIWRDLFVSLLAKGSERDKKKIPEFLEDIETIMGINALERLLYGGRQNVEDDDEEDDDYEDLDEDLDLDEDYEDEDDEDDHDDMDDDDASDDEYSEHCVCDFHASYWPDNINRARIPLREHVEQRLLTRFRVLPSVRIYDTLMSISQDGFLTQFRVNDILHDIAGDTPDNLVAALDIHIANGQQNAIAKLLKEHAYLLRPRDTVTLQCSVAMLEHSAHNSLSISILEKELDDSLRSIFAAVRSCFCYIDNETHKKELLDILKLRSNSVERQERTSAWIEQVASSSGNGPLHPMAFAAMMMGLPPLPGADDPEEIDLLGFVDLDQHDPDLDDLRDEYRPNLKSRFDGWVHLAQTMKGGPLILAKLYLKAIEMMPWLRGTDIVNEMINRLQERPSKLYVVDALTNLSAFAKVQRKKLNIARNEQARRAKAKAQAQAASTSTTEGAGTSSSVPDRSSAGTPPPPLIPLSPPTSPVIAHFPTVSGGLEDVD
ncbi:hypothetical protein CPC08DRAFT_709643 [Agrocybe pediades]|nr:hypothetical protein CPC08DRAFT_709643 [Agrocybe pediades]